MIINDVCMQKIYTFMYTLINNDDWIKYRSVDELVN